MADDTCVTGTDDIECTWLWPALAVSASNEFHLAWRGTRDGIQEIYYRSLRAEIDVLEIVVDIRPGSDIDPINCRASMTAGQRR